MINKLCILFALLIPTFCFAQAPDYCQLSEVPGYGVNKFDGPAHLPERCVATRPIDLPSPGGVVTVAAGGSLQAAYDSAICGTTIKLAHGNVWTGPFAFASKGCDNAHWITIMSDGKLPGAETRISLTDLPQMASIVLHGTQTLTFGDHIHFGPGIELQQAAMTGLLYTFANLRGADHIVFDRVYAHGNDGQETQRAFHFGTGKYIAVINSYLANFKCFALTGSCSDAQALGGGDGQVGDLISQSGPFKIRNNFLEGSTENIIFGGDTADGCPTDITVQNNHFFKRLSWNPNDPSYIGPLKPTVKNLFELKNACRVLIEGNIFENTWGGYSQRGYAILFTPKNQNKGSYPNQTFLCPNCTVTDVTIRYNTITTAAGAFMVGSGTAATGGTLGGYSLGQHRTSIHDITADNLQYPTCYGCGTSLFELGSGYSTTNPPPANGVLSDLLVQNVDIIAVGDLSAATQTSQLFNSGGPPANNPTGTPQMTNIEFINNIASTLKSGIYATGGGPTNNCVSTGIFVDPASDWPACMVGNSPMTGNLFVGITPNPKTQWPTGNFTKADFSNLFVNFNGGVGGDYHLVPGTPYAGANIDLINQYIKGAN